MTFKSSLPRRGSTLPHLAAPTAGESCFRELRDRLGSEGFEVPGLFEFTSYSQAERTGQGHFVGISSFGEDLQL